MIDRSGNQLSLRRQCQLLGISQFSLYYKPVGLSEQNVKLMHAIDEEYTLHPFRGSRGMRDHLAKQGFSVGRHQVRKLHQLMVIQSVLPGPHTSKLNKQYPVFPYLLQELDITHAHQVLSTDITYIC